LFKEFKTDSGGVGGVERGGFGIKFV